MGEIKGIDQGNKRIMQSKINSLIHFQKKVEDTQARGVGTIKAELLAEFSTRFYETNSILDEIFLVATFLDPRCENANGIIMAEISFDIL